MKNLLYSLCFLICSGVCLHGQVPESDSMALVDFYNSLNGEDWYDNSGWLEGPITDWSGIGLEENRVYEIDFYDNNLEGELPGSLGNLSELGILNLGNNKISGNIPSELGNCKNLLRIYLTNNQIEGNIPESFALLNNLEIIRVYKNQMSGEFPAHLLSLTSLMNLNIGSNSFSGTIPENLGDLTNLTVLDLSDNEFTGPMPASFKNFEKISACYISGNQISGELEDWMDYHEFLYYFRISNNQFSGELKAEFFNPEYIQLMDVNNNNFSYLENLESLELERLNIGGTRLNYSDIDRNSTIQHVMGLYNMQDRLEKDTIILKEGDELTILSDIDGEDTEYQWFLYNEPISGEENATFNISEFNAEDQGWYKGVGYNYDIEIARAPVFLQLEGTNSLIEKRKEAFEVTVFPNPVLESITLNIEKDGSSEVTIYNQNGEIIKRLEVHGTKSIETHDLKRGLYIIECKNQGESVQQKIVKL